MATLGSAVEVGCGTDRRVRADLVKVWQLWYVVVSHGELGHGAVLFGAVRQLGLG